MYEPVLFNLYTILLHDYVTVSCFFLFNRALLYWLVFSHPDAPSAGRLADHDCADFEFMCGNGQCIDRRRRCNGVIDCDDTTDELDCGSLYIYLTGNFTYSFSVYLTACMCVL